MAPPVSFAMVDTVTGGDAASLAALRALAEVGEGHAVPIITNASPGLLGQDDLDGIDRLDNKKALFEAPERVPWRSEAHRPSSLWVALALNPVLARQAYDKRSSRIREATVEELPNDEATATIWMQPAWAVASLVLQSFEKTGWPCRITGAREGGLVENLPVREIQLSSGEKVAIPTQAFFATDTQKALSRIGLLALASQPNSDEVYLLTAPTAYVPPPKKTYDSDTTEPEVRYPQTPLVDQLFVARLAQFLRALGGRIGQHKKPDDVKQFLEAALWELFDGARPGSVELDVQVQAKDDGLGVHVTVRPRRFLGVAMEEITLGVPLG
jgi:type VI secretion system ImpC/EvpB family protein